MKTQEEIDLIIVNCGAFRFNYQKTANNITSIKKDSEIIVKKLQDEKSEYSRLYSLGIDKGDYSIMEKLFSLAKTGDIQALKEYDKRLRINVNISGIRNRITK